VNNGKVMHCTFTFYTSFSDLTLTVHTSWLKLPVGISHIVLHDESMSVLRVQEVFEAFV